jgi:hypothetical protein
VVGDQASINGLKVLGGLTAVAGGPLVGAGQRGLVALMNSERAIELSIGAWNLSVDTVTTGIVAATPVITNPAVQSAVIDFVEGATPGGPPPMSYWGIGGSAVGDWISDHR